jgi:hypothetical protein
VVVNDVVRIIYDLALEAKENGYNVTVLHEINGFKCKWLTDYDSKYKSVNIEYIITKKSAKSKKESQRYSFIPTDTLIVPDMFQDIFDNINEVKLIQKILLVTGYAGLGALAPGATYKQLGVERCIFLGKKLKDDYEKVFPNLVGNYLMDYKIDTKLFDKTIVNTKEIYPVICISNIGNTKLSQQVVNIFYNLYPNLNVFSFKLIARDSYEDYVNSLAHSCLFVNLDDNLGFKKSLIESINMGVPVTTFNRRELEDDTDLVEFTVVFDRDAFSIAKFLSQFCAYWLSNSSTIALDEVRALASKLQIEETYKVDKYNESVKSIFTSLQEERVKYFLSIKQTMEKSELNDTEVKQ